jgi:hypothetical protein
MGGEPVPRQIVGERASGSFLLPRPIVAEGTVRVEETLLEIQQNRIEELELAEGAVRVEETLMEIQQNRIEELELAMDEELRRLLFSIDLSRVMQCFTGNTSVRKLEWFPKGRKTTKIISDSATLLESV